MRQIVAHNLFSGVILGAGGLTVSHLQYADDTLLTGQASVDNLWAMKTFLQAFEISSGLRVNFAKSNLIGVNVLDNFLDLGARFLNKRGSLPFKYLGIPVGQTHVGPLLGIICSMLLEVDS